MTWTWVRPADPRPLAGRPFLDLGTGDGQTLATLVSGPGLVVGLDRSPDALRAARRPGAASPLCADAGALPFADARFATVLAGDVFHHLDDRQLAGVLGEVRRVLTAGGRLLAWWYERPGRPGPDAPRFPRPYDVVAAAVTSAGMGAEVLALEFSAEPVPPTTGLLATR